MQIKKFSFIFLILFSISFVLAQVNVSSSTSSDNVLCTFDSQCGPNGPVPDTESCFSDDVYKNYLTYTCNNPGTSLSFCTSQIEPKFLKDCGVDSCEEFSNQLYCKNNEVYKKRTCYNRGCLNAQCAENSTVDEVLVESCQFGCDSGKCNGCGSDGDCNPDYFGDKFCEDSSKVAQVIFDYSCSKSTHKCVLDPKDIIIDTCFLKHECDSWTKYCNGSQIYQNRTCYNSGCYLGGCKNTSKIESIYYKTCSASQVCLMNGTNVDCKEVNCFNDLGCNDNDKSTIDKCLSPGLPNSTCEHKSIKCFNDKECPEDRYEGKNSCDMNKVVKNFTNFSCENPGTENSRCINKTDPILIKDCGNDYFSDKYYCSKDNVYHDFFDLSCSDGACIKAITPVLNKTCEKGCANNECKECTSSDDCLKYYCDEFGNNYCKGNSVYHNQTCYDSKCSLYKCQMNNKTKENFVEKCENGCSEGKCIACSKDSDCGKKQLLGVNSCDQNKLFDIQVDPVCNNPGSTNSFCSNKSAPVLVSDCGSNYCDSFGDKYCKNGKAYHSRKCYNKGCALFTCYNNFYIDEQVAEDCAFGCFKGDCTNMCNIKNLSGTYDSRNIKIDISSIDNSKISSMEMAELVNPLKPTSLCIKCNRYSKNFGFNEGVHNLLITCKKGNIVEEHTYNFFVDYTDPKVLNQLPFRNSALHNGVFTIFYTENNLKSITLYYGKDKVTKTDCPSGINKECIFNVDTSAYNGKSLNYLFELTDMAGSVTKSRSIPVNIL